MVIIGRKSKRKLNPMNNKEMFPDPTFAVPSITGQIIVQMLFFLFENDLYYMIMMILRTFPFLKTRWSHLSKTLFIWHCLTQVTLKQFVVKCRFNIICSHQGRIQTKNSSGQTLWASKKMSSK